MPEALAAAALFVHALLPVSLALRPGTVEQLRDLVRQAGCAEPVVEMRSAGISDRLEVTVWCRSEARTSTPEGGP